jgi:hypothetical protein
MSKNPKDHKFWTDLHFYRLCRESPEFRDLFRALVKACPKERIVELLMTVGDQVPDRAKALFETRLKDNT